MDRIRVSVDGHELAGLRPAGRLLGVAGAPGAGKSTLATALASVFATVWEAALEAVVVPMDGFHYADAELVRRGLRERKGAPETFDAEGYAALLARIAARRETVVVPAFDRSIDQPVAGSIAVSTETGLVVTEGNYLLLDVPRWQAVRAELDAVWLVHVDQKLRLERLVARHVRFGKTPDEARAWVARVDQPNAVLVEAAAHRADLVLDLTDWQATG